MLVTPREAGGYGLDAQWSDDFHHAVHVALTGETEGYYADFEPLVRAGQGVRAGVLPRRDATRPSADRDHGVPIDTDRMPTWRLVVCSQNHDQIGNRAAGDRLTDHLDEHQLGCAALLTLAGPFTPMLFQGEEWAASTPFCFFTSHPEPELGRVTAEGRFEEFERMGWDPAVVPDPQDPDTFRRSKLDWDETESGRHARLLAAYRRLAELRRDHPDLTDPAFGVHLVRGRRGVTGVPDAARRPAGRRQLRRRAGVGGRSVPALTCSSPPARACGVDADRAACCPPTPAPWSAEVVDVPSKPCGAVRRPSWPGSWPPASLAGCGDQDERRATTPAADHPR